MSENSLPKDLLYNQDYSWVRLEDDVAILGIIKPSADRVSEFVFIQLPQKGQTIKRGKTYISLEAVKWSGHLSSPLSGEIVEVNDSLFDDPSIINKDPYNKGWIIKLKFSNKSEAQELLKSDEAQKWVDLGMKKNSDN